MDILSKNSPCLPNGPSQGFQRRHRSLPGALSSGPLVEPSVGQLWQRCKISFGVQSFTFTDVSSLTAPFTRSTLYALLHEGNLGKRQLTVLTGLRLSKKTIKCTLSIGFLAK